MYRIEQVWIVYRDDLEKQVNQAKKLTELDVLRKDEDRRKSTSSTISGNSVTKMQQQNRALSNRMSS